MTLSNVFSKTMRDRWLGWAITAVTLTLFLLFGMSVYREIDLTVYTSLPEAFRSLVGIGDDIDVGGLADQRCVRDLGRIGGCGDRASDGSVGDRW